MKIAIATDEGVCSNHFGYCSGFQVYELENKQIVKEEFFKNPGHKPGFLPNYLAERGIKVIISSSMGSQAQKLFAHKKIEVIVGVKGKVEEVIRNYLQGKIVSNNSICQERKFSKNCKK